MRAVTVCDDMKIDGIIVWYVACKYALDVRDDRQSGRMAFCC